MHDFTTSLCVFQAEKWLREQAQKEGWAKATKLQNRSMSQGLVAITGNSEAATMIEASIIREVNTHPGIA